MIREERMSDAMLKLHVAGKFVLHHFTAPDTGYPHDHPFDFVSVILHGGYDEEIYRPDGTMHICKSRPLDIINVPATRIHRIIHLPEGECWTAIFPGPWLRESGFWRWDDAGAWFKTWQHDAPWVRP